MSNFVTSIIDNESNITKSYNHEIAKNLNLINPYKNIYIKKFGNPKLIFQRKKKILSIEINDFNDKVCF